MAYTDDWENLMNGVFGPGGKLRFDTQKTSPEKPGLPDMNAALLEQQKKLDEMLKKQNAELRRDTTQEALAQSRKMLEDMEADGLLAKGTTEVKQEHLGSFEGEKDGAGAGRLRGRRRAGDAPAFRAGDGGPHGPERHPALRCARHGAAFRSDGDGPLHGRPGSFAER